MSPGPKKQKGGILEVTTTAINPTAGTRFSNPMTHALPNKLPFDSQPLRSNGARSGMSVASSAPSWQARRGTFPHLSLCPDCAPLHLPFLPSLPPPPIFILGATQEGVYRTVGSNIQVQKLLNSFFGKKISPSTCSTSVQQGIVLCRLCNLRANMLPLQLLLLQLHSAFRAAALFFRSYLKVSGIAFITLLF